MAPYIPILVGRGGKAKRPRKSVDVKGAGGKRRGPNQKFGRGLGPLQGGRAPGGRRGNKPSKEIDKGAKPQKPVRDGIDAEADLEFGRSERLLDTEIGREVQHQQTIGQAFAGYRQRLDQIMAAQAAADQAAQASLATAAGEITQAAGGLDEAAQSDIQARAKLLGFGDDAAQHQASVSQQAGLLASQAAGARAATVAREGLNQTADLGTRAAIGAREEIEARQRGGHRRQELEADRADLQVEKRNWRTAKRAEREEAAKDRYAAILATRAEAKSDAADRKLRLKLGLITARQAEKERRAEARENAKDRASEERQNAQDNATALQKERMNGGSGSGSGGGTRPAGNLSPSDRREWRQKKAHYQSAATRLRNNLRKYKSRESAWHATAQELGGDLSNAEMQAIWWIAKGKGIPKGILNFLRSEFPGGRSPWG